MTRADSVGVPSSRGKIRGRIMDEEILPSGFVQESFGFHRGSTGSESSSKVLELPGYSEVISQSVNEIID